MKKVRIQDAYTIGDTKVNIRCAILKEPPGLAKAVTYNLGVRPKYTALLDTRNCQDSPRKSENYRIYFDSPDCVKSLGEVEFESASDPEPNEQDAVEIPSEPELSDEEMLRIISDKFFSVNRFAQAASQLKVRSLIVSGTAGTGKTYEVMTALEAAEKKDPNFTFSVIKGTISPIALYIELYNCRNGVLVLDDCDDVLLENTSLQLLKAATESHKSRKISYKKMSSALEENGIPQSFYFEGSVIILTNTDLETGSKKRLPHFEAIISRAHYVNAVLTTDREKLIRIRSVIATSGILKMYLPNEADHQSVIDFIENNYHKARELSVRTVVKISELRAAFPDCWERLANSTILK